MAEKSIFITVVRLPADVKDWLEQQAEKNGSSQTSEVLRAVRERMENMAKASAG